MRKIGLFLCCSMAFHAWGQVKSDRFKPVTATDFVISSPVVDTNSNAIILADVGNTDFVGNNSGSFTLVFNHHKRMLIRSRNAFDEATIKVPVYNGPNFSTEEKFEDLEAYTYNLVNGQVVTTKLEKTAVFTEKVSRDYTVRKFTFPNIKEGSIIEYKYTVKSPYFHHLRPWYFQDSYPSLWSEYNVTIPPMFHYITTKTGYLPYTIDSVKSLYKNYSIAYEEDVSSARHVYQFSGDAINGKWAMKDVPAFKSESYISSSRNLISNIKFQLRSINYSETNVSQYLKDWFKTSEDLLKDEDFGLQLSQPFGWGQDIIKQTAQTGSEYERAKKIFDYVRDNYKCNDHDAKYLSQPLKKTYQTKTGNVADLNMLLTAIFINSGFEADPVLLSTRDNGFVSEGTAILNQYNYVVCRVKVDSNYVLLDASHNRLGFGRLSAECYNKFARVINTTLPALIEMSADSLEEVKTTMVTMVNSDKQGMEAGYSSNLGYLESIRMRDKLAGTTKDEYFREVKKDYPADISLSNFEIDSLKLYEEPISIRYDIKVDFNGEDIIYFNPMLSEGWKKNPFTSATRYFPVEMPYKINETYLLSMEIPKGYVVDEMPKSTKVNFNENEGSFEYIIAKSGDYIQLRSRLRFTKATFEPEDYQTLRDFFTFIVNKQAEQVVFKKKK